MYKLIYTRVGSTCQVLRTGWSWGGLTAPHFASKITSKHSQSPSFWRGLEEQIIFSRPPPIRRCQDVNSDGWGCAHTPLKRRQQVLWLKHWPGKLWPATVPTQARHFSICAPVSSPLRKMKFGQKDHLGNFRNEIMVCGAAPAC